MFVGIACLYTDQNNVTHSEAERTATHGPIVPVHYALLDKIKIASITMDLGTRRMEKILYSKLQVFLSGNDDSGCSFFIDDVRYAETTKK